MDTRVEADTAQAESSGVRANKHNGYAKRLLTSIKRANVQAKKTLERNAACSTLGDIGDQITAIKAAQKSNIEALKALTAQAKDIRTATGVKANRSSKAGKGKQRAPSASMADAPDSDSATNVPGVPQASSTEVSRGTSVEGLQPHGLLGHRGCP